jgi:hypothetical protein
MMLQACMKEKVESFRRGAKLEAFVVRLDGAVSSGNRYSLFSQGQSDAA